MPWLRKEMPELGNKYYNTSSVGGYYNSTTTGKNDQYPNGYPGLNVLPNCVGQAWGAFNETWYHNDPENHPLGTFTRPRGDAETNIDRAPSVGLSTLPPSAKPPLGGLVVWGEGENHVAYIYEVLEDGDAIKVSQSGYGNNNPDWLWWYFPNDTSKIYRRNQYGTDHWGYKNSGKCLGFIPNPGIKDEEPEPELKAPQLSSITQNGDSITITGKMNATSGYTTKVDLYINWDSTSVSESNYDITQSTTIENFNITISKPKEVGSVAIIAIQRNNNGKNLSSSILTKTLIRSIPCIHVSINNIMQQGIPYIYHNGKWAAIYNDEV